MKLLKSLLTIPVALTLVLANAGVGRSQSLTLSPGFQPNPKELTGTSGGTIASKCGNVSSTPSHTVKLTAPMDLVFSVEGANSLTLMIQAPDGSQFCVMSNGSNRSVMQPGYWQAGDYSVFVGDRGQAGHAYTLKIAAN